MTALFSSDLPTADQQFETTEDNSQSWQSHNVLGELLQAQIIYYSFF